MSHSLKNGIAFHLAKPAISGSFTVPFRSVTIINVYILRRRSLIYTYMILVFFQFGRKGPDDSNWQHIFISTLQWMKCSVKTFSLLNIGCRTRRKRKNSAKLLHCIESKQQTNISLSNHPFFYRRTFWTHAIDSKVCAYKTTSGRDKMCSENVQCEENSCTLSQSVVRYYFFVLLILMFVLWLFNMQKGASACIAVEDDVNDSVVVHTSHQSDNIIQSKALWSFWCTALDEILNKLK